MIVYKLQILLLFSLAFYTNASSQPEIPEMFIFPDSTFYSKGKIYLENNESFVVNNLIINKDRLTFKRNNSIDNYLLSDVYIVKVPKGTRTGRYAAYGGLIVAVSALGSALERAENPNEEFPKYYVPVLGGLALGGALIGALVGSRTTAWKTLYVNLFVNEETTSLNLIEPQYFVKANPKYLSLKVVLSF